MWRRSVVHRGAFINKTIAKDLLISGVLFGNMNFLPAPWPSVDPLVLALPASILAMGLVLLLKNRDAKTVSM